MGAPWTPRPPCISGAKSPSTSPVCLTSVRPTNLGSQGCCVGVYLYRIALARSRSSPSLQCDTHIDPPALCQRHWRCIPSKSLSPKPRRPTTFVRTNSICQREFVSASSLQPRNFHTLRGALPPRRLSPNPCRGTIGSLTSAGRRLSGKLEQVHSVELWRSSPRTEAPGTILDLRRRSPSLYLLGVVAAIHPDSGLEFQRCERL